MIPFEWLKFCKKKEEEKMIELNKWMRIVIVSLFSQKNLGLRSLKYERDHIIVSILD